MVELQSDLPDQLIVQTVDLVCCIATALVVLSELDHSDTFPTITSLH